MDTDTEVRTQNAPWNKGKLAGQKAPLRISEIWAIRVRLEIYVCRRELALFNLAIDSKLRGCDLVQLWVQDVCHGSHVANRATVMQQKTKQPVQFELTAVLAKAWLNGSPLRSSGTTTFCSPVASGNRRTSQPDSMRVLFINGSMKLN